MYIKLTVNEKSEAMEALQTFQDLHMAEIHKRIAHKMERFYHTAPGHKRYFQDWGGRTDDSGNPVVPSTMYNAIKDAMGAGGTQRGFLTGSTLASIKGESSEGGAIIGVRGSWPAPPQGKMGMRFGPYEIDIAYLREVILQRKARDYKERYPDSDKAVGEFSMSAEEMSTPVRVKLSRAGMEIKWPDSLQGLYSDMMFKGAAMQSKQYGRDWPGAGTENTPHLRTKPKDFVYLDGKNVDAIYKVVESYVARKLGITGVKQDEDDTKQERAVRAADLKRLRKAKRTSGRLTKTIEARKQMISWEEKSKPKPAPHVDTVEGGRKGSLDVQPKQKHHMRGIKKKKKGTRNARSLTKKPSTFEYRDTDQMIAAEKKQRTGKALKNLTTPTPSWQSTSKGKFKAKMKSAALKQNRKIVNARKKAEREKRKAMKERLRK